MTDREYYFNKLKSTFDQIDVNCDNPLLINKLLNFAEEFNSIIEREHSAFYVTFYDVDGLSTRYYRILGSITADEAFNRFNDLIEDDAILNGNIKEISKEEYDKFMISKLNRKRVF